MTRRKIGLQLLGPWILLIALSACTSSGVGGSESKPEVSRTSAPVASASPTSESSVSPSPTSTPPPDYYTFTISCKSVDYSSTTAFKSMEEAWAQTGVGKFGSCEAIRNGGRQFSPEQRAALSAAGYEDESLPLLVTMCANLGDVYDTMETVSVNQVTDIQGIATLCPNRPGLDALLAKAGIAQQSEADRAAGIRFGAGVLLVGTEAQPGRYVHEGPVENCYWERTDQAGNTIDNFFTLGAARVEVVIQASDYSFNSSGCGEWVKIG